MLLGIDDVAFHLDVGGGSSATDDVFVVPRGTGDDRALRVISFEDGVLLVETVSGLIKGVAGAILSGDDTKKNAKTALIGQEVRKRLFVARSVIGADEVMAHTILRTDLVVDAVSHGKHAGVSLAETDEEGAVFLVLEEFVDGLS